MARAEDVPWGNEFFESLSLFPRNNRTKMTLVTRPGGGTHCPLECPVCYALVMEGNLKLHVSVAHPEV